MNFPSSSTATTALPDLSIYVEELRRFSATYEVPCGNPDDLQVLCDRLAHDQAFFVEFQAMIRSILYRENCQSTTDNLLNLVGQVWGGPDLPNLSGTLHAPVCDLAAFLRKAMKFPRLGADKAEGNNDLRQAIDAGTLTASDALATSMQRGTSMQTSMREEQDAATTLRTPTRTASGAIPWWAEASTPPPFLEPDNRPSFLSQAELITAQPTDPLTADPWQTNSTFHQELVRFAQRRSSHTRPNDTTLWPVDREV